MSKAYKPLPAAEDLWEWFSYNPLTGNLHWRIKPAIAVNLDQIAGGVTGKYLMTKLERSCFVNHRLIWKWVTAKEPCKTIDHRDLNPANNCFWNLREATRSQQNANRSAPNKTGLKGVSKHNKKWRATIQMHGVREDLGVHNTPEEAHQAYCEAAERLHGDFARLG